MPIIIEFEKFVEYQLNKRISDRNKKRLLRGTFRDKGSKKLHTKDIFMAYELQMCSAFEVYKCYVAWYNHTNYDKTEPGRIPVSAEWIKEVN